MCINQTVRGRVVEKQYDRYNIKIGADIYNASLKGAIYFDENGGEVIPCVGDWIEAIDLDGHFIITEVFERKNCIMRQSVGRSSRSQILAVNIDYVFVVLGLDGGRNYSDRLLERLMLVAWNSGATPIIVLNKSDQNSISDLVKCQAETIAPGVDILVTSTIEGTGINAILSYLEQEKVGVFIGPSGVGKSTITNFLMKEELQKTSKVKRSNKRGRHTTTSSYMFELESGAYVIDSPGLRDVQSWADNDDVDKLFEEISTISDECKFRDCTHQGEPGCAVQEQLEEGYITPERYDSYLQLKREIDFWDRKRSEKSFAGERQYDKNFTKLKQKMMKHKFIG
ncbi:ribosome small subunit-dependent GTPase A [Halosquirtibacter xylanolyticus]|uniref:ribosome small subunit-dependent GTPase A n=1 Tax=Halosquirtibacter xylanolyticus TaxID=3374599 RepID=UPI003749ACF4|nr:ribosome small subunit-dependent GTPase A [Prolixibacteraceae bacterium]